MNMSKKVAVLFAGLGLLTGAVITAGLQAHAQTSSSTNSNSSTNSTQTRPMGHAPLGNDGNVTAVNGTTISMQEEADEGGAVYSVDASKATFTKNGASATLADIKVGDKIFVTGTVNGTNVSATQISDGRPGMGMWGGHHMGRPNDNDADDAPASGSTAQ